MIALLSTFKPNLILTDNLIGLVQAAEVIKEIKSFVHFKNISFILCSGHVDIKSIALEMSANAYLEKPFDLIELYCIIDTVLQGSINSAIE
ncbi:PleD family two-component system response regulator [Pedobacter hartonius]|uniref:Two-component system, response regulator, stage 0 sporulation protein F n=1 Tax=Pedobacter hartonius TaxID=425514 RepID=A0A1H3VZZ8_9SPHI|nr:response regulator [Pedobacter hartonius]SDZ80379.1 two-component system, response regulator, stage 0 sporulation protein F [Pedobacter hartonius]